MKIILSWRIHHYMIRLSTFLIALALIAGMAGCGGGGVKYDLTITSTSGGSVTEPGEGTSAYDAETVVNLTAEAEEGYQFINWTGDVGTITDTNDATTTITMNGDYSIMANFVSEIYDWYDLDAVRDNLGRNYTLMNDLDSNTAGYTELASLTANDGKGWEPIGTYGYLFSGAFDGQGYEISDLFIDRPDETFVGLFGVVNEGGVIDNVGVVDAVVTGHHDVGGLVGHIGDGTLQNSHFNGNVTGHHYVGGLIGSNQGTVSDSYSTGSVNGIDILGGLMGWNDGGTISDCYSNGSVSGNWTTGGLVGWNDGTVSTSFWDTETSGQATSAGGTGKNTTEMQDLTTFSNGGWSIVAVANPETRNLAYIWNIVDDETYPFLSWEPVS
jgi:hypothetical protein